MLTRFGLVCLFLPALVLSQTCLHCIPQLNNLCCPNVTDGIEYHYNDVDHCHRYWVCLNGCASNRACPFGELYDVESEECKPADEVDCGDIPCDQEFCPTSPTLPPIFDCPGDGYYPDEDNCIKYWHCFQGDIEHLTCDSLEGIQLLYEPTFVQCDFPENVNCGNRPICDPNDQNCATVTTGEPTTTELIDFDCPGDGYFADPDNCIKYFHCYEGVAIEHLTCARSGNDQLLYNDQDVQCDFPDRVDCGSRPICDENDQNCYEATTKPPTYCDSHGDECNAPDQLIPEGTCKECFCQCIAPGVSVEQCCQNGLFFDEITLQCNYPDNIGCA